jgi:hypothetical protein
MIALMSISGVSRRQMVIRPNSRCLGKAQESKSLFASSEKEESCSFLKKRTKRLLISGVGFKNPGLGRRTDFEPMVSCQVRWGEQ